MGSSFSLPLALVGFPPGWFPSILRDLAHRSARGEWTECDTPCVLGDLEVANFCLAVKDGNVLHTSVGTRRAVVPGALLAAMLPALMPDLFKACEEAGTLVDAGGQRQPLTIVRTGMVFQARIRFVSLRTHKDSAFLDVLAEIYSPQTDVSAEKVRMRVTQSLTIRRKKT